MRSRKSSPHSDPQPRPKPGPKLLSPLSLSVYGATNGKIGIILVCIICEAQSKMQKCFSCGKQYQSAGSKYYCHACCCMIDNYLPHAVPMNRNPLVLIVENARLFAKYIGDKLGEAGFETIFAFNGKQAFAMVKTCNPTLILVDLQILKRNRFVMLEYIKKSLEYRHIPILIMSGMHPTSLDIDFLHDLGADGLVLKKNIHRTLLFRIMQLLQGSKETQA